MVNVVVMVNVVMVNVVVKVFPGHSKYQNFVFDDKCGLPAIRVVQGNIQGIQVSVFFVVRPVDMVTLNGYYVIRQFHGNIERR